jgi:hypothetical protein
MEIKFEKKFSEQHIDEFTHSFYENYTKNPSDSYLFDLTETEWLSNQGLLLLTGIIQYLYLKNTSFEIKFVERGTPTLKGCIDDRKAKLIVQVWDIWQIGKLFSDDRECDKYLGITNSFVKSLKNNYEINFSRSEIYGGYDITPFVRLNYQEEWNDDNIIEYLKEYHYLNDATIDIVEKNNCEQPFVTNVFGEIVTKELYENFLTHFGLTFFNAKEDYSFFCVNLNGKINDEKYSDKYIQEKLKEHLEEEELSESSDFFKDRRTDKYYNRSFISYSFLDFGEGIVNTLREKYYEKYNKQGSDSDILKFAFKHDSSRNPIRNIFEKEQLKDYIPRGLFDVLSIVKRYRGLLIARSCYGKIIYDFSKVDTSIEDAFSTFGDANLFFSGTFITLYLPAIPNGEKIDTSTITPIFPDYSAKEKDFRVINLKDIIEEVEQQGDKDKYTTLYDKIYALLNTENKTITFFSFDDIKGNQLLKKIIFFLVSSYEVNNKNNFVILNPPKRDLLEEINHEIIMLSQINKDYKIHSLPFVYYDKEKNDISLEWLGLYNENDIKKLNNLLYEDFTLSKDDFKNQDSIVGHILSYDKYGNVISNLPNKETLKQVCENPNKFLKSITYNKTAKEIIQKIKKSCISREDDHIYLCNGNYYQFEYIELTQLLMNKSERDTISNALFSLLEISIDNLNVDEYKFIAITSSSQSIVQSWIDSETNPVQQNNVIRLDNYNNVSALNEKLQEHPENYKYILVCDIIATGFLSERIEKILLDNDCKLDKIAVVVNSIKSDFSKSKEWYQKNKGKIMSIHNYPLEKFLRDNDKIKPYIQKKKIIRINPYTNVPIIQTILETNIDKVIFEKEEFIEHITDKYVQIGLLKFNNILHPYFFNTKGIIKEIGIKLLQEIWNKGKINLNTKDLTIFYPKESDIKDLNFKALGAILKSNSICEYELERYNIGNGWEFPHTTEYFKSVVEGNPVLLLDDGSCTGDSLIQMINEVSYFSPKRITTLCLIGRVGEQRREFLSLINEIKKNGNPINVEVFFATHWHIPTYYLEDNPFLNESNWFNKVIKDFPNAPSKIKTIISKIDKELQPQPNRNKFKDYEFLPKPKITSSNSNVKKDIIYVRDEIGKIIDYKFYCESFEWFDKFMSTYESKDVRENRYKDIELLCAAIIYEPHLFKKIKSVLPDIVEKIQEFIKTIIWGNVAGQKLLMNHLTYEWNKRDMINLLFIVFDSKELKKELTIDKFKELIAFSPSLNYILYRLLKYFPLKAEFSKDKFDEFLKEKLKVLSNKENGLTDKTQRTEIKKYIRFLNTLPNRGSFDDQINTIRNNYIEQDKDKTHDARKSLNHNISGILAPIRACIAHIKEKEEIIDSDIQSIRSFWFSILDFLNPILGFCTKYKGFISPFPYRKLLRDEKELRTIISKSESVIFSLIPSYKEVEKLESLIQDICKIQNYLSDESDFRKLFISQRSSIDYIISKLYSKISELGSDYKIIADKPNTETMKDETKIPQYYVDELIISEIINNIRKYAQKGDSFKVEINTNINESNIEIEISNIIQKDNPSNGNNEGTSCLELLSDFPYFKFKYDGSASEDGKKYIQRITFKLN